MGNRKTWIDAFAELGDSVLTLLKAELSVVIEGWKRWFIELAKVLALVAVSLLIFVYLPFLALFAAVDGVKHATQWPHYWQSALAVLGLAFLVIALLGAIGAYILKRRMESPVTTVQRRLDDNRGWWQRQVFLEDPDSTARLEEIRDEA
ncbi:MAG: phage holin family protein [Acidobacteriota bacterium]